MVDELRPRTHEGVAAAHDGKVLFGLRAAVPDGGQQLGVEPPEARQLLGVAAVVLAVAAGDQRRLPGVRHDHFVAELRQQAAQPR